MSPVARFSGWLLAVVWLLELVHLAYRGPLLSALGLSGLLLFVALALLRASPRIRILFAAVIGAAVSIAAIKGDFSMLLAGLERARIFGAFLPSVLLLRATAEHSPRVATLRGGIASLDRGGRENWMVSGSHALGAVLNVGAMGVMAPMLAPDTPAAERESLAAASARGVGTAVMWSPFFVSLGFVSHLVPTVPLWQAMALGAGTAVIGLAISYRMFTPGLGAAGFLASTGELRPLLGPMLAVVAAVLAVASSLALSGPAAVGLGVPFLCAAYLAFSREVPARRVMRNALDSFGRLADELIIVVGATVLGTVLGQLREVSALAASITPAVVSGVPLIAALVLVLVAGGLVGLHPMIGATVLVPLLAGGAFGVSPVVLVAAAVFAWGLSSTISIWSLPVAAASSIFRVPLRALSAGRPLRFAALYAVAAIAYLGAANALITR
ncbi:MAG: hypothetical protein ABI641_02565 [Caldimonas sp.]